MNEVNTTRSSRKQETPEQKKMKKTIQIICGFLVFAFICYLANKAQAVNP